MGPDPITAPVSHIQTIDMNDWSGVTLKTNFFPKNPLVMWIGCAVTDATETTIVLPCPTPEIAKALWGCINGFIFGLHNIDLPSFMLKATKETGASTTAAAGAGKGDDPVAMRVTEATPEALRERGLAST